MNLINSKNLILSVTVSILLTACGSGGSSSNGENTYSAYLSDSMIAGVTYNCGSDTGVTDSNGTFNYSSSCSEVTFNIGGIYLGSIATSDITSGGVLYPADLLGLDINNTSDTQLTNMLQLLQSLDSDSNPNNGIDINATAYEGVTLDLENNTTTISDINTTLTGLNLPLIDRDYAVAHYEDTLRQDLNISVDTVPPAPAIPTVFPVEAYTSSTDVTVSGEVGAKIWIDGVYSNIDIDENNSATINLNTSNNTDVNNTFEITLRDASNSVSDPATISIFVPSQETLDTREVEAIKVALEASSDPRAFTYTQIWNSGEDYNITFSEQKKAATTETQTYDVIATITKGSATDTVTFTETVPFSQDLRDIAEVAAIKNSITSRTFSYSQQWTTGDDYNVTFSEQERAATTETQTYPVTTTITKGSATDTVTFTETVPFSQDLRDIAEVAYIKNNLTDRSFTYTQLWTTGDTYAITFSEQERAATTETQTYPVTTTITKGSATDTVTFTETVPFSQDLRDIAEVAAIKNSIEAMSDLRSAFTYTQQWNTGSAYIISYSEAKRIPTAIDQSYDVTITITKGLQTDTIVFTEFVPTTNVNIALGDGTTTLINDEYADAFVVTNGGVFQKIGDESRFIGAAVSFDTTGLSLTSSGDLLNYITTHSSLSGLSSISLNNSSDGSLVARYEISSTETNLYELLEGLLSSMNYTIDNIDFTQYTDIDNTIIDFYIEYDANSASYVIVSLSDKTIDVDSDITKIVNKDSIVEVDEVIVNEQSTFTVNNVTNRGDFVFVIDDSGSMGNEQASVIDAIENTFTTAVAKYNLDWKATVIGTENSYNYDTFTDDPTENNITKLSTQLDQLSINGGNEVGMKRVYGFLVDGSISERENSSMTIIYASDEPEHTELSEIGLSDSNLMNSYFVQNGIRYNSLLQEAYMNTNELSYNMALATGGDIANLYNYATGYDQMIDLAVRYAVAKSSSVKLNYPALASSITVHVDGIKVTGWEYAPNEQAIVFDAANMPDIGAEVIVTYSHLDYSTMVANAKAEFDALNDADKRDYSVDNLTITFDPASPATPLADSDQTYDVTVTFDAFGYTETSTFEETVLNFLDNAQSTFDALPDDEKRTFVDTNVTVVFDPATPNTAIQDADQTYDVTVTFEKDGETRTSIYEETVYSIDSTLEVTNNTDWLQAGTSFESQNHTDNSISTLNIDIQRDSTISYSVSSEGCFDSLFISINGGTATEYCNASAGDISVTTGDSIEFIYSKDSSVSSGSDSATITLQ